MATMESTDWLLHLAGYWFRITLQPRNALRPVMFWRSHTAMASLVPSILPLFRLNEAVGFFFPGICFLSDKCMAKGMLRRFIWYELLELEHRLTPWIPRQHLALLFFFLVGWLGGRASVMRP